MIEVNSFSSFALAFDSEEVAGEFKAGLMEGFCCSSVSSATVAKLFEAAPILKKA